MGLNDLTSVNFATVLRRSSICYERFEMATSDHRSLLTLLTNGVHRWRLFPATYHRQSAGPSCRRIPTSHNTTNLRLFLHGPYFADHTVPIFTLHCDGYSHNNRPPLFLCQGLIQDGWDLVLLCIGSADTQSPPSSTHVTLMLGHHLFFSSPLYWDALRTGWEDICPAFMTAPA